MRPELEYYLRSQIRQSFRARRRIVEENDILVVLTHLQAPSVPCPKSLSALLSEKVKKLTSNVALTLLHHFSERSEEHTSELQSRLHLVCRLLLEKKKINNTLLMYYSR